MWFVRQVSNSFKRIKMIKFSEVKIGQKFVFDFDMNCLGDYYYSYEKVSDERVECISCPKTEKCIGVISPFKFFDKECLILPE
jgi:hypothetical protein